MENKPAKKGDKFKLKFFTGGLLSHKTLTVLSFFGRSGIEYATYAEALADAENIGLICVKNVEYGGVCDIGDANLVPKKL